MTLDKYTAEISRRGGETSIGQAPYGKGRSHVEDIPLQVEDSLTLLAGTEGWALDPADQGRTLMLLHVEAWRFYSRGFGSRKARLSYLCGTDDNGPWAVRVPGSITRVREALAWTTPTAAVEAVREGRRVRRQGDVYVVQQPRGARVRDHAAKDARWLDSHNFDTERRVLVHRPAPGERRHRQAKVYGKARLHICRRLDTVRGGAAD